MLRFSLPAVILAACLAAAPASAAVVTLATVTCDGVTTLDDGTTSAAKTCGSTSSVQSDAAAEIGALHVKTTAASGHAGSAKAVFADQILVTPTDPSLVGTKAFATVSVHLDSGVCVPGPCVPTQPVGGHVSIGGKTLLDIVPGLKITPELRPLLTSYEIDAAGGVGYFFGQFNPTQHVDPTTGNVSIVCGGFLAPPCGDTSGNIDTTLDYLWAFTYGVATDFDLFLSVSAQDGEELDLLNTGKLTGFKFQDAVGSATGSGGTNYLDLSAVVVPPPPPTTTVPEPAGLAVLGVALAGLGLARRRR